MKLKWVKQDIGFRVNNQPWNQSVGNKPNSIVCSSWNKTEQWNMKSGVDFL